LLLLLLLLPLLLLPLLLLLLLLFVFALCPRVAVVALSQLRDKLLKLFVIRKHIAC
jgi:hypothetical protein